EVYGDIEGAQLSTVAITSQADPTDRREIASNLGRLGGFVAMADGMVMWNDVDPYAPAAAQPAAGPPLLYESHDYIYDPSANRNIELPVNPNGVAFTSGHYVIWQDRPGDPAADTSMSFADLDQLR
ncbi:MAG: hypothetical protein ACRDV3_08360, partial [Acidothermaceae bacterium]